MILNSDVGFVQSQSFFMALYRYLCIIHFDFFDRHKISGKVRWTWYFLKTMKSPCDSLSLCAFHIFLYGSLWVSMGFHEFQLVSEGLTGSPGHYGPNPGENILKFLRLLHLWVGNILKLTMVVAKWLKNSFKIGRNEILWLKVEANISNLL